MNFTLSNHQKMLCQSRFSIGYNQQYILHLLTTVTDFGYSLYNIEYYNIEIFIVSTI